MQLDGKEALLTERNCRCSILNHRLSGRQCNRQYIGDSVMNGMFYFQQGMLWLGAELGIADGAEGVELPDIT